ncbi:MAG TPA: AAA family ATPase, partial [Solirubrobacteraceae bacterium]|nr:AAA family ATPase [Solirubrobacteraceae bacterium]
MAVVLPDTELLERTAELEALEAAFAGVGQSGGRLVLVAGEAGVGKTALLRRFAARTGPTLWGDCDALFTLSPLGPLVDIAATTGGELAERIAEGAPPHVVAAALLQELASREHGKVVVFEDVHWADEATLDVLRVLSRRIATVPALLVASYRDDESLRVLDSTADEPQDVERRLVGPVDVLEHDDRRPAVPKRCQER